MGQVKYRKAWTWTGDTGKFISRTITENPLLNVCCGNVFLGDVRLDAHIPWCDIRADARVLPFKDNSFSAVLCDPPWQGLSLRHIAQLIGEIASEAIRVAPVFYMLAPWMWGSTRAPLTHVWVRYMPGIMRPVLFSRYEKRPDRGGEKSSICGGEKGIIGIE